MYQSPQSKPMHNRLKAGIESLSGMSMDHVRVHYNSRRPAQLNALAYAQGSEIHVAPGQERHLPHEAWHIVQQAQGRVKPTIQMKGSAVNDDMGLEREADVMGARAMAGGKAERNTMPYMGEGRQMHSLVPMGSGQVVQRQPMVTKNGRRVDAANWKIKEAIKWLNAARAPNSGADPSEIAAMDQHVKKLGADKTLALTLGGDIDWLTDNADALQYMTREGTSQPSYYFHGADGKWARLRMQHDHGPTVTKARYTQQFSSNDAAALKNFKNSIQRGETIKDVKLRAQQMNINKGRVSGEHHLEVFTNKNPAKHNSATVKDTHPSRGVIDKNVNAINSRELVFSKLDELLHVYTDPAANPQYFKRT